MTSPHGPRRAQRVGADREGKADTGNPCLGNSIVRNALAVVVNCLRGETLSRFVNTAGGR